jgi:TolB-like protein/Tfp pilus assembly protein PilF
VSLINELSNFYAELRKRRVLKVTVAYVVMAWVIIEGTALIFPALLLPDWTHRIVVVLGIIGFPVVVLLAWIFDITPAGVERTSPAAHDAAEDKGRSRGTREGSDAPPSIDSALASIAVVPFESLSANADDEFLARALSAEISTALSQLPEVRVAPSRATTALEITNDMLKIGELLNVQYVLTGSLRRSGDSLRILAELSDVEKGSVLWSQAYDRDPDDLIRVEEEIATAIVGSFGGEQMREQIRIARDRGTGNEQAQSLVHRARAYVLDYSRSSVAEAESFARQAIRLDPEYASAHAALASVLCEKVNGGLSEDVDADLSEALESVEVAVSERPRDAFVLKLAGNVWAGSGRHDEAIAVLRRAIEITPFDFGAWGYLASVLVTTGNAEDAAEANGILDRIIEAAPQHPGQAYWMHHKAVASTARHDYANAAGFARKAVDRQPGLAWAWYLYANALAMGGDKEGAKNAAGRAHKANPELSIEEFAGIVERTSGSAELRQSRLSGLETIGLLPNE